MTDTTKIDIITKASNAADAFLLRTAKEVITIIVEDFIQQTADKIQRICRRNHVPQDVTEAFITDVTGLLHIEYKGLCATTEQMRILTASVKQKSWDKTENAAPCIIAKIYEDVTQVLDGSLKFGAPYLHSVSICELAKRQNKTIADVIASTGGTLPAGAEEKIKAEAQRLYYSYAILIIGERTDATAAELLALIPDDVQIKYKREEYHRKLIEVALTNQQQRKRIEERKAQKRATPAVSTPALFNGESTIHQYQTITNMLSGGIQTADTDEYGRAKIMRPLRQGIEEQRAAAASVIESKDATKEQKRKAAQFLATTTAMWQVLDGIQVIPQKLPQTRSGDTYTRYDMTPHQLAVICTGQEHPNTETVTNCMRGFAWLRTQSMQVWETIVKRITLKDENGKVLRDENGKPQNKFVERQICTNFQPVIVEFRSEYENNVMIEDATRVRLLIHDIIRTGHSNTEDVQVDKNEKLKAPAMHVLQLKQFYDFKSEEEKILRTILINQPKLAEDKLLAALFDYTGRQAQYDRAADAAKKAAAALEADDTATDEQKRTAQDAAKKADYKAKYYITNHMGDDVKRLQEMLDKAKGTGIITEWRRTKAKAVRANSKYGSGYVYTWQRPKAEEKPEAGSKKQRCRQ